MESAKPSNPQGGESYSAMRLMMTVLPWGESRFRNRFFLTLGLLLAAALLNATVPNFFAAAVDAFSGDPGISAWAIAPASILAAYVFIYWLSKLFNEARWMLYGPIEQRAQRTLALRSSEHLLRLSLGFHLTRNTGEISRVMDNGLRGLREFLFDAIFLILPFGAEILFVTGFMLVRLDFVFAIVLLVTIILYGVVLIIGSDRLRKHQRLAISKGAVAHGEAIDALINYETVKYFGNEQFVAERYDTSLADVERLTVRAFTYRSFLGFIMMTILTGGMLSIFMLAVGRIEAGTMSLGELVLVNAYLLQLVRPLERLGNLYRAIKQALVELEQLVELLDEAPDLPDRKDAIALPMGPGEVRFENVEFSYRNGLQTINGLDFQVPPGTKVALVGPTGAGKTTIARLLYRFYDPDAGSVFVDDCEVQTLTLDSLRSAIAVVPQDPVLFNDTIGYNIAFGRPTAGQQTVEEAARSAHIHEFIQGLPEGYATRVGERGLKLSGGEKQRVAIARALLKNPRIFILDEATSALDSTTEQSVQACLRDIGASITTLVIAHRLSTIVDADMILVLDQGRIVERGVHTDLLIQGGLYAELWQRQAKELKDH
ncbi:MAG TPA: ABC transporter ATP-binding protein/permease [Rhodospirillales bacterium]|jgi:ATP-binding cassette subfamily B protein|nr:ABC transporter ATP-binding protein/permease [Rhodospirillales bacterium]